MTDIAGAVHGMEQVEDYVASADISGWDVLFAVVTLAGAWLLSKVTRRLLRHLFGRVEGVPDDAKRLLSRMGGYVVIVLGLAYALSLLGADVAPLLTVVLIVVVVIALALRSVAENFAAGIVLQTRRTVRFGDEIAALGHTGVVAGMNGRSVVIRTADGRQVHLPNVKLLEGPVANHTVLGARRSELVAHITGEVGIDVVERVRAAAAGAGAVLTEPAPAVSTVEIGVDRLSLTIGFWHHPPDGATANSAVAIDVAAALRALNLGFTLGPPPRAISSPSDDEGMVAVSYVDDLGARTLGDA